MNWDLFILKVFVIAAAWIVIYFILLRLDREYLHPFQTDDLSHLKFPVDEKKE